MKTKTLKKNKVNVITLGCSKNIFDSEVLMGQLKANNFEVEHESVKKDSAIVIINTCGFIDNAKQESIDTILACAEAKDRVKLISLLLRAVFRKGINRNLKKKSVTLTISLELKICLDY